MTTTAFARALGGVYYVRHTLITINGFMGQPDQMMPADTARALGDDVDWEPLVYNSGAFPLGEGVKDGYAKGVALIRSIPGTFALAEYSEGTIIGAQLEAALLTGELQDRNQDWIASVKWGDACRELHQWFGDAEDPGGAGISGPDNVVDTDPRIRSYVYQQNEKDPYTNCPQTAAGKRMTLVYQLVLERWKGELASFLEEVSDFFSEPVENIISIVSAVIQYVMFVGSGQVAHMDYPIDDAVAYLRQRMTDVPARTAA